MEDFKESPIVGADTALAKKSGDEIDLAIKRMEKLAEGMSRFRTAFVSQTVPSDWAVFGKQAYLEGDGAMRVAPLLGLDVSNVQKTKEYDEKTEVTSITVTLDAYSRTLDLRLEAVSRSAKDDEDYLKGKKPKADIEDVRSAAYTRALATAVQKLAGLGGLTPEELTSRYGMKLSGDQKVEFRTGASDAKKADREAGAAGVTEIQKILFKISNGESDVAADILQGLTVNKEKGWAGKRNPLDLTEKGVAFVLPKLKQKEKEFDEALAKMEGGVE